MGLFYPWHRTLHLPSMQFMRLLSTLFSSLSWSFLIAVLPSSVSTTPSKQISSTKLLRGDSVPISTLNNVKQYWPQYKFLRDTTNNHLAAGVCTPGHNLWSPVVQPIFYPPYPSETETNFKQIFRYNRFSTSLQNNLDTFVFYYLKSKNETQHSNIPIQWGK